MELIADWSFVLDGAANIDEALANMPPAKEPFSEWVCSLIASMGMSKVNIIERSRLNPTSAYQILSGARHASRDKLIQLGFGMGLGIEDLCELLMRGGTNPLDPTDRRDVAIAYAATHKLDVRTCNKLLSDHELRPLCTERSSGDERRVDAIVPNIPQGRSIPYSLLVAKGGQLPQ